MKAISAMRARRRVTGLSWAVVLFCGTPAWGEVTAADAVVYCAFDRGVENLAPTGGTMLLGAGLGRSQEGCLEFTTPDQMAELDPQGMAAVSRRLREVKALAVGGWFQCRRVGEQTLAGRGDVTVGRLGERFFRPSDRWINFCLGTDDRGFLMGTINGNGTMPFIHVTVNDVPILTWQQLAVVKTEDGYHHFYQNGAAIHADRRACWAPSRQPWQETGDGAGEPIRLRMPAGGLVGEFWVIGRAISPEEIAADYQAKRGRYKPAPPGRPVLLRDMYAHPPAENGFDRQKAMAGMMELFGPFPAEKVPLEPRIDGEEDCGGYLRRKVSIQVQPGDRMPAYLLIPKTRRGAVPAVICFYGTTGGSGKRTTVGLSGPRPDDPPVPNRGFAVDMVEAGFVAMAPDFLRDGERIHEGDTPYDTTRFYEKFPNWSIHGKDAWDTMRAIDYLETLDFVDGRRIGMIGHSYGGHSTIFAAALEPRIKVAVANGPVSAFREHGMHWAVPKDGRNSQSLPAMRPYILEPERPLPVTFGEITALVAPRPLMVGQAAGERRPIEEQNCAVVRQVYADAGKPEQVRYVWYAGDHDFPPEARAAAVAWFHRWFGP
jgi:dienelactone hydrolase